MASTADKKLIDCYWFLQDQCKKDDSCEYRHSQSAHDTQTLCKFWQQNQCTNASCKFRHPSGNKAFCVFFAQGKCFKGDACPFQHAAPPAGAAAGGDVELLEQKKQQEAEELRKIQAQRKIEEDRLARIKAQREQLESKKQPTMPERKNAAKERKLAVGGTFGRTVTDMVKGAQDKGGKAANRVQQKEAKSPPKAVVKKNKTPKETQAKEPQPTGPVSFGVKSLEQIKKEKEHNTSNETDTAKAAQPQQAAANPPVQTTEYLEELRKKNQQKFAAALAQKTEQPAAKSGPPTSKFGVKAISPKRQLDEEPIQRVELKRQKVEPVPVTEAQQPTEATTLDEAVDIEFDEDTLALAELLDD